MPQVPLVIIHGYSDVGKSFEVWHRKLTRPEVDINICNWISLSNEITIRDIGEGLERALRAKGITGEFDALVHSTGMLVIRSWLADDASRRGRLKHLIAIAPATFGSPLAPQGRSLLGSIFKGSKDLLSPDFLEAGDMILDALEPGSAFTWRLTEKDILGEKSFYGVDGATPYVFVFCGTKDYSGVRGLVNKPGTDGTVRWAGVPLNTEKLTIDFRRGGTAPEGTDRYRASNTAKKGGMPIPFWPVPGVNHATIVSEPPDYLVNAVTAALAVNSRESLAEWEEKQTAPFVEERKRLESEGNEWQQFVVHVVDQLGDPVRDFHLSVAGIGANGQILGEWTDDKLDMHAYSSDKSFRCYHVNVSKIRKLQDEGGLRELQVRLIASSGSAWVDYHGQGSERLPDAAEKLNPEGRWDAVLNIPLKFQEGPDFFFPFTTTLLEMIVERDALPFGGGLSKLVGWM